MAARVPAAPLAGAARRGGRRRRGRARDGRRPRGRRGAPARGDGCVQPALRAAAAHRRARDRAGRGGGLRRAAARARPRAPRPRLPARPVLSDLGGPLDWSRLPAGGCSASWQSRTTTRATPSSSGTPRCRPTGRTISSSPDRVRPAPLARPAGREGAWVGGGSRALYSRGATDEGHARKASLLRARAASGEDRSARNASSSARPPSP